MESTDNAKLINSHTFKFGYIRLPEDISGITIMSNNPDELFERGIIQRNYIYPYFRLDELMKYDNFIPICLIVRDEDEKPMIVCMDLAPYSKGFDDKNIANKFTELVVNAISLIINKYYICKDDNQNDIAVIWNEYCITHFKDDIAMITHGKDDNMIEIGKYDINGQYQRLIDEAKNKPPGVFDNMSKNICFVCLKQFKTLACSKCHEHRYCSKECQIKDWPKHKKNCRII